MQWTYNKYSHSSNFWLSRSYEAHPLTLMLSMNDQSKQQNFVLTILQYWYKAHPHAAHHDD